MKPKTRKRRSIAKRRTLRSIPSFLHLWTFKTPILALKNLNDLNKEFILSIG